VTVESFGFPLLREEIGLKKLVLLSKPIRSRARTTRDSLALVFPRFTSARCNALSFDWFIGLCVFCDWPE